MSWDVYEAVITRYNVKENGKYEIIVRALDSDVDKLAKPPTPIATSLNGGMFISHPDIGQHCLVAENPKSSLELQIITYLHPPQFNPQGELSSKEVPIGGTLMKSGGLYSTEFYMDRNGITGLFAGPEAYFRLNGKDNITTHKTQSYTQITAGSVTTMKVDDNATFHRSEYYADQRYNDPFKGYEKRLIEERGENSDQDGFIYRQTVKLVTTPGGIKEDSVLRRSFGLSDDGVLDLKSYVTPTFNYQRSISNKHAKYHESLTTGQAKYESIKDLNYSGDLIYLDDFFMDNTLYKTSSIHKDGTVETVTETQNLYCQKILDPSSSMIKIFEKSGDVEMYTAISSDNGIRRDYKHSGNGFSTSMKDGVFMIYSLTGSVTIEISDNSISCFVGNHNFQLDQNGLRFNGKSLVFETLVDFLDAHMYQLGMGNMGAPVPMHPSAISDFITSINQIPTQNEPFKTS